MDATSLTRSAEAGGSGSAATVKRCVIFKRAGIEIASPWYTNMDRAQRALAVIRRRYGSAVLYRD